MICWTTRTSRQGSAPEFKIGTRIPGVIEVGTVQGRKRRLFAAVHHDTPRGLRVQLERGSYDEWIVGLEDPEGVLAQIRPSIRPN